MKEWDLYQKCNSNITFPSPGYKNTGSLFDIMYHKPHPPADFFFLVGSSWLKTSIEGTNKASWVVYRRWNWLIRFSLDKGKLAHNDRKEQCELLIDIDGL